MDPHQLLTNPLFLLALLVANALFAAAELSLACVRRARVEHLVRERRWGARTVLRALEAPERVAAGAQFGRALSTVALGAGTELTLHGLLAVAVARAVAGSWLAPALASGVALHAAALGLALLLVASLQVVLGQQLPTVLSEQRTEAVALVAVPAAAVVAVLLAPLTAALARVTAVLSRLLGLVPADLHALAATPEEIQVLVERSEEGGEIQPDEGRLIKGVFEFGDLVAREVMTPRRDVVALRVDASRAEVLELVVEEAHSRLPVYDGSLDTIVGVLLVKDLVPLLLEAESPGREFQLRALVREPLFVPETKPVSEVLTELRARGVHMAIVLDEFGGTEGIVTLEDLIEPIVGEIYDEYDVREPDDFSITSEGDVLVDGGVAVDEVNERFALHLPVGDFDTIGGLVFGALGRLPLPGDEVALDGAHFRVEQTEDRRIVRLRMRPHASVERLRADSRNPTPKSSRQTAVAD